jgi:hypothetical protein
MLDALVEAHPGAVPRFTKGAEAEKAWRAVVPVHEKDRNPHVRYKMRRPGRYWDRKPQIRHMLASPGPLTGLRGSHGVTMRCMIHWQRAIQRLLFPVQQPAQDRDPQAVQRDPS